MNLNNTSNTKREVNGNQKARVFRRYPNRKIYDTQNHYYVCLRDIIEAVQSGQAIVVLDSRNKQDITKRILEAALFRVQREQLHYKNVEEMQQMIRDGLSLNA